MVVDASAAVWILRGDRQAEQLRRRLQHTVCHAPHLFDAEVGHAVRGLERAGELTAARSRSALRDLPALIDHRYPHVGPLADRAWELRHNLSFYDALYAALAAELELPLVTSDARLAQAPNLPCAIEFV